MISLHIEPHIPLAPRTTLQVGGAARWWCAVDAGDKLHQALDWAAREGTEVLVLGGGSNMVVADQGYEGLALTLRDATIRLQPDTGAVYAGAGLSWDRLVEASVTANLAGLECLSGIPGLVGAAPIQNIGAYGQELGDSLVAVDVIDIRAPHAPQRMAAAACGLGYRHSHFRSVWWGRYVITGLHLQLRPGGAPSLVYGELQRCFAGAQPNLAQVRQAVLQLRRSKSMVYDARDTNHRSVGSFFVNPVVPAPQAETLVQRFGSAMPRYGAADPTHVKLSAGWLIEHAGLPRGFIRGNVGLSTQHALAIINRGGARAADVVELAVEIRERVYADSGIWLQPEPIFVGFTAAQRQRLGLRHPPAGYGENT